MTMLSMGRLVNAGESTSQNEASSSAMSGQNAAHLQLQDLINLTSTFLSLLKQIQELDHILQPDEREDNSPMEPIDVSSLPSRRTITELDVYNTLAVIPTETVYPSGNCNSHYQLTEAVYPSGNCKSLYCFDPRLNLPTSRSTTASNNSVYCLDSINESTLLFDHKPWMSRAVNQPKEEKKGSKKDDGKKKDGGKKKSSKKDGPLFAFAKSVFSKAFPKM